MSFIRQKTKDDCGVCSFSMLTGLDYEFSKDHFFGENYHGKMQTKTKDIVNAINRCLCFTTDRKRLKPVKSWEDIPDNSLVKISRKGRRNWHWVVWRNRKIYDPARGVFKPLRFGRLPSSFIQILRLD